MGREAHCACRWGDRTGIVHALLEGSELIVRGAVTGRAVLRTVSGLEVAGDMLVFSAAGERVELALGAAAARRWADAIAAPPPSLARKLGIAPATRVAVTGPIDDAVLHAALVGSTPATGAADLAIVRADDVAALAAWHDGSGGRVAPAVWIVYPKGRNSPLPEAAVRDFMRSRGFIDTKVASVSERLTALRFSPRP